VKTVTLLTTAIIGVVLMVMPAHATTYLTEYFSFTSDNSSYTVGGKFTYDPTNGQLQTISGNVKSGSVTQAITGLVPADYSLGENLFYPNPSDSVRFFSYDNLFIAGAFTFDGVLFSFGSNNYGGLYFNPGPFLTTWLPDGPTTPVDPNGKLTCPDNLYCPGISGTLNFSAVSPVPEISSWLMMLLGFIGVATLGRAVSSTGKRAVVKSA